MQTKNNYPRATQADIVKIALSEVPAEQVQEVLAILDNFKATQQQRAIPAWIDRTLQELDIEDANATNG